MPGLTIDNEYNLKIVEENLIKKSVRIYLNLYFRFLNGKVIQVGPDNPVNQHLNLKIMITQMEDLINKAYSAFNERDIDKALSTMQPHIQWSKAWEGGYISGHDEIRAYWTRQWKEINPKVEPIGFKERPNGSLEVEVHQKVKDLADNVMFDGMVKHIYTFENGLINTMDIELVIP